MSDGHRDNTSATETANLIIEDAQAKLLALDEGDALTDDETWDRGYQQGRKDACRILLLSFTD